LKSSPTTKTSFLRAKSITPSTIVFYGDPLIYEQPSKIEAHANTVEAEISELLFSMALSKFSAES